MFKPSHTSPLKIGSWNLDKILPPWIHSKYKKILYNFKSYGTVKSGVGKLVDFSREESVTNKATLSVSRYTKLIDSIIWNNKASWAFVSSVKADRLYSCMQYKHCSTYGVWLSHGTLVVEGERRGDIPGNDIVTEWKHFWPLFILFSKRVITLKDAIQTKSLFTFVIFLLLHSTSLL